MTFTFTKRHDPLRYPFPKDVFFLDLQVTILLIDEVDALLTKAFLVVRNRNPPKVIKYHVKEDFPSEISGWLRVYGIPCSLWHCIFSSGVLLTWLVLEVPGLWEVMVGPTVCRNSGVWMWGWWWMVKTWMWSPVICIISLYNLNWCRMLSRIHQLYLIVSGGFKILPTFLSLEMQQGLIMKVYIDTR